MKVNDKVTKKVKARLLRGKGKARFWKVYTFADGGLRSKVYWRRVRGPGRRGSTRRTTSYPANGDHSWPNATHIERGYHVYINRKDALLVADTFWQHRVVPVYCYGKDFVAGGTGFTRHEAVFTHIEIKPEDFKKAIGK